MHVSRQVPFISLYTVLFHHIQPFTVNYTAIKSPNCLPVYKSPEEVLFPLFPSNQVYPK